MFFAALAPISSTEQQGSEVPRVPLPLKSTWTPPGPLHPTLSLYKDLVLTDVAKLEGTNNRVSYAFTTSEHKALQELQNHPTIVIRRADKGGAVVVMDRTHYLREAERQLAQIGTYKILLQDPTIHLQQQIKELTIKALDSHLISKKEFNFLNGPFPTRARFYLVPKVHKDLFNPPGRPIVSTRGTLLEPLSIYVDSYLRPLLEKIPSYIRDTSHFLTLLEEHSQWASEPDILLATMDVAALYTNIPQQAAHEVVMTTLRTQGGMSEELLEFLAQLTALTLFHNFFEFEGVLYHQVSGVAMGATCAPSIANLYMQAYESQWLNLSPYKTHLLFWRRYIDDVFIIWRGTPTSLSEFWKWLNKASPHIQFTYTYHENEIVFLDVMVQKSAHGWLTTTYKKPTDRNTLLHYTSRHPKQLRDSLPLSQFIRYRRNCSTLNDYKQQARHLMQAFHQRGYPSPVISTAYKRARFNNRDLLLHSGKTGRMKKPVVETAVNFITKFSPFSGQIKRILKRHQNVLSVLPGLQDKTIRCVWTRHSNLREQLSPAKLRPPPLIGTDREAGHRPCGNCNVCIISEDLTHFTYHDRSFKLRHNTTCGSDHVIYSIRCPCGLLYIGKTTRPLRIRINEHKSRLKCKKIEAPIVQHCLNRGHVFEDLRFFCVDWIAMGRSGNSREKTTTILEQQWIYRLQTVHPGGLNNMVEWGACI